MKRFSLSCLLAGLILAAGLTVSLLPARAADDTPAVPAHDPREPSRAPVSWELTFKHGPLERIIINADGKDQTYWYMRYTVTNNSGRDILFVPDFQILAETGTVINSIKIVPNNVFEKIKGLSGNNLMVSPLNVDGKLLQGEDNARDSVAVFPALDSDARNFQVFAMGLSGETSEVTNPVTKKPVTLQKTLELDYNLPGQAIGIDPVTKLTATKWVMK